MFFYLTVVRMGEEWERRAQLLKASQRAEWLLEFWVGRVFTFLSQGREWGGAKHPSAFFSAVRFSATRCQNIHGSSIVFLNPILRVLQIQAIPPRFSNSVPVLVFTAGSFHHFMGVLFSICISQSRLDYIVPIQNHTDHRALIWCRFPSGSFSFQSRYSWAGGFLGWFSSKQYSFTQVSFF